MKANVSSLWANHATTMQLLIMQVLTAGTAFMINILSSAVMPPDDRGYMALLIQITYVATVFAMLGVDRPFVAARRTNFDQAIYELHKLISPGYAMLGIALVGCLTLYVIGHEKFALPGFIVALYLAGNTAARVIRTGYIASGRLPPFLFVSVATQFLLLAMAVVLFLSRNANPQTWFLAYGISGLVALVVALLAVIKIRKTRFKTFEHGQIRWEGLRLLPASFGNTAMLRSDRLLLPLLSSTSQLGLYIVVATMMELASWPIQNWVDASLNRWKENDAARKSAWSTVLRAALVALFLGCIMGGVSYVLILFVFSAEYASSALLILPLGIATVIYAASRVQQGLLVAAGRAKSVSGAELAGMVVSVGAYVVLIPMLGALGAALASVGGYLCCFITGMLLLQKSYPRHALR